MKYTTHFHDRIFVLALVLAVLLSSCFKKEDAIPAGEWKGQAFVFTQSIYDGEYYYSLAHNEIVNQVSLDSWDISFENGANGWHIRINSGNLIGITNTGITNFDETSFNLKNASWLYDTSNGNPDSTAVGKWVDTTSFPHTYTNNVYLLGKYNGSSYVPYTKLVFTEVTDTSYTFSYASLDNTNSHTTTLKKEGDYNQLYFSISANKQVTIEPEKQDWDMLFTPYYTTLYTDAGVPTPYIVRGVLINPYKVEVALDTVADFFAIDKSYVAGENFKTDLDVIGYNWKAVQINEQANTAVYSVRANYSFFIKNSSGDVYKLKFMSYTNSIGTDGYPTFIFQKL